MAPTHNYNANIRPLVVWTTRIAFVTVILIKFKHTLHWTPNQYNIFLVNSLFSQWMISSIYNNHEYLFSVCVAFLIYYTINHQRYCQRVSMLDLSTSNISEGESHNKVLELVARPGCHLLSLLIWFTCKYRAITYVYTISKSTPSQRTHVVGFVYTPWTEQGKVCLLHILPRNCICVFLD